MYTLFRLVGSSAAVFVGKLSKMTSEFSNPSMGSALPVLDESYITADDTDGSHHIISSSSTSSISLYRRWLWMIFGTRGSSPTGSPVSLHETQDGWLVIDQISRQNKIFEEIWDPTVSGDWSEIVPQPLTRTISEVSPVSSEVSLMKNRIDVSGKLSLLRWAFKTEEFDLSERNLDRFEIWKRHAKSLLRHHELSFLESVVTEIPDEVTDAISRDIERTNPPELRARMTNILHAYAARNPSVGFCQGMTYVVSALLQIEWMTDEEAFDILCALIEGVNTDYYDNGLSGLHTDLRRLEEFMGSYQDQVLSVPIELVLVEPMMCLFTRLVPVDSSWRIIDIALTQGKAGMFAIYLALIELLRQDLDTAVVEAESPSMAIVDGAVAFKVALVNLMTDDCDSLIRRAEGFLITYRSTLEALVTPAGKSGAVPDFGTFEYSVFSDDESDNDSLSGP